MDIDEAVAQTHAKLVEADLQDSEALWTAAWNELCAQWPAAIALAIWRRAERGV
jgi:hypothetical protein